MEEALIAHLPGALRVGPNGSGAGERSQLNTLGKLRRRKPWACCKPSWIFASAHHLEAETNTSVQASSDPLFVRDRNTHKPRIRYFLQQHFRKLFTDAIVYTLQA
jgi:hypothetical protein